MWVSRTLYVVANPVRGLLARKILEDTLDYFLLKSGIPAAMRNLGVLFKIDRSVFGPLCCGIVYFQVNNGLLSGLCSKA